MSSDHWNRAVFVLVLFAHQRVYKLLTHFSHSIQHSAAMLPLSHPEGPASSHHSLIRTVTASSHTHTDTTDTTDTTDLHDVFHQSLVGADLGALQPADVLSDPGDEGELGSFAHGVSRRDPDEAEQTGVI